MASGIPPKKKGDPAPEAEAEPTYRMSMLPFGTYANPDGTESLGLALPGMLHEPLMAVERLFGTPSNPGTFTQGPDYPGNADDMRTLLLSTYGGNALNPLSHVPEAAVASGAVRTAENPNVLKLYHSTPAQFEKFDPAFTDEIGFHFGTKGQANDRAWLMSYGNPFQYFKWRTIPVEMEVKNPARISDDPVKFTGAHLGDQLVDDGIMPPEVYDDIVVKSLLNKGTVRERNDAVRNWLIDNGYDAVAYPNKFEGGGTSYMALGTGNVRDARTGATLFSDTGKPSLMGSAIAGAEGPRSLDIGRMREAQAAQPNEMSNLAAELRARGMLHSDTPMPRRSPDAAIDTWNQERQFENAFAGKALEPGDAIHATYPDDPSRFLSRFNHNGKIYEAEGTLGPDNTAVVDWIGPENPPPAGNGANTVGRGALRAWKNSFVEQFPDVKSFSGERISGARAANDADPMQTIGALFSDTGKPSLLGSALSPDPDNSDPTLPASIRYNNPGAQWPGQSSERFGANDFATIGGGNKIAIFADPVHGAAAQFDLLSRNYAGLPLSDAIKKWSGGNASDAYVANIVKRTGLSPDTVLAPDLLSDPARAIPLAKAMAAHEAGRDYPLSDDDWTSAFTLAHGDTAMIPPILQSGYGRLSPPQVAAPTPAPGILANVPGVTVADPTQSAPQMSPPAGLLSGMDMAGTAAQPAPDANSGAAPGNPLMAALAQGDKDAIAAMPKMDDIQFVAPQRAPVDLSRLVAIAQARQLGTRA